MKRFKDLKVGDIIYKVFYLKKQIEGFNNYSGSATVQKVMQDPDDPNLWNVWCKYEDGAYMEFDVESLDLNKTCITHNNEGWIEVYST